MIYLKTALVDYRISTIEEDNLNKYGFSVLKVPPCNILYTAVCGHPDMLLHPLENKTILVHNQMDNAFITKLEALNYKILLSEISLCTNYPGDIALNALNLDNIFLHNLKYTDPLLLKIVNNKKLLNVKQGYSKCSTAIVNSTAAITSDIGIYNMLSKENISVLLLPPGDIELPGLNYGFIGGSCGILNEGTIAFFGNLNKYKYRTEILNFLIRHDVKPVFLSDGPLIDRGTLFVI